MSTQHATVHFNDQGTPVADAFDDVYFSNDSGIDETRYVFMAGNGLPARWLEHRKAHFVIAETGFGTGLNCLVAMQAFAEFRQANPEHPLKQLYLLSTEKFPLTRTDLQQALSAFPSLQNAASALLAQYPPALSGCHRLQLGEFSTSIDLWLGDVHDLLPQWHAPAEGLVDAWFLDGFAPSKNPDMWTEALFSQMARLSRPGTTLATFTAAGLVRRGLQEQGFAMAKQKGFGRKRDMLTGCYEGDKAADAQRSAQPWPYYRFSTPPLAPGATVAVVGAGLAGAHAALALVQRGINVTLVSQADNAADGASGNAIGGFYPQLHARQSPASLIQAHSFLYARRHYAQLLARGAQFGHQWCGVVQLDFTDAMAARHIKLIEGGDWPADLVSHISADQASAKAGVPLPFAALCFEEGGWLSPKELTEAILELAKQSGRLECWFNQTVRCVEEDDNGVVITTQTNTFQAERAIFATGAQSINTQLASALPLRPVRGQVEVIPDMHPTLGQLQCVICHKGYLSPAYRGAHAMGSTYSKNDMAVDVRETDSAQNLATHQQALADTDWAATLQASGTARAAVRLGLPDHQVACGALPQTAEQQPAWQALGQGKPLTAMPSPPPQRIMMLTGLGSRGLTTAPLMAEILASQICGEPLPLAANLLEAVSPQRFIVRECIRQN